MEAVTEHFNQLRSQLPSNFEEVQSCISQLKEKIPTSYDDIEPYVNALKNVSTDDIVSDFSNLKVTPITVLFVDNCFHHVIYFRTYFGFKWPARQEQIE